MAKGLGDLMLFDANLVKKYHDNLVFDYTEYPTKSFWSEQMVGADYEAAIADWYKNYRAEDPNSLLYVHTPFCEELCYFCLCSKEITQKYDKVKEYLYEYQIPEIEKLADLFSRTGYPEFKEVYFGGGSPTYYREDEFLALRSALSKVVDFSKVDTWTVEIDPRRVDKERLAFYANQGVNRLSFGIQDFDHQVQVEINRIQPPELLDNLLAPEIRSLFKEINFDLLVGLPKQTVASIRNTIEEVVKLKPTQLQTMYVHYKPDVRKYMTRMVRNVPMPDFLDRRLLFLEAKNILENSGYLRAGFESYALPDDTLTAAMDEHKALYNSLGTQPGANNNFFAVGSSAHSSFGPYYFQNFYEQPLYKEAIAAGQFPIYRGLKLTEEDLVRRRVIKELRTFFFVDLSDPVFELVDFSRELECLEEFEKDGLLELDGSKVTLTEMGRHFCPKACEVFDKYSNRPIFNDLIVAAS